MFLTPLWLLAFPAAFLCKSRVAFYLVLSGGLMLAMLVATLGASFFLAGFVDWSQCQGTFPDAWGCSIELQESLTYKTIGVLFDIGFGWSLIAGRIYLYILIVAIGIEFIFRGMQS